MRVLIDKTIYEVIDVCRCCNPPEVCIIQTFDYADGYKRQLKTWAREYKIVRE